MNRKGEIKPIVKILVISIILIFLSSFTSLWAMFIEDDGGLYLNEDGSNGSFSNKVIPPDLISSGGPDLEPLSPTEAIKDFVKKLHSDWECLEINRIGAYYDPKEKLYHEVYCNDDGLIEDYIFDLVEIDETHDISQFREKKVYQFISDDDIGQEGSWVEVKSEDSVTIQSLAKDSSEATLTESQKESILNAIGKDFGEDVGNNITEDVNKGNYIITENDNGTVTVEVNGENIIYKATLSKTGSLNSHILIQTNLSQNDLPEGIPDEWEINLTSPEIAKEILKIYIEGECITITKYKWEENSNQHVLTEYNKNRLQYIINGYLLRGVKVEDKILNIEYSKDYYHEESVTLKEGEKVTELGSNGFGKFVTKDGSQKLNLDTLNLERIDLVEDYEVKIEADTLLDMLIDETDKNKRDEIIAQIELGGNENDLEVATNIVDLLYGENASLRINAATALGWSGDPRAINALIKALGDENIKINLAVKFAISKFKEAAIQPLIETLADEESEIDKREVSAAILKLDDYLDENNLKTLISDLAEIIYQSQNSDIKSEVLCVLMWIGSDRKREDVVPPFLYALVDSDEKIRCQASQDLEHLGRELGEPVITQLITAFIDAVREGESLYKKLRYTIAKIGGQTVPELIEAFENPINSDVFNEICSIFERWGASAVPHLKEALKCENLQVRKCIIASLGLIVDLEAINALISVLGDETYPQIDVIEALVNTGEPAVEALIKALEVSDLREGAKQALIKIGNPSFIPVIENLLNSGNPDLEKDAVDIIKGIANEKSEQETGIDPDVDILSLNSMSKDYLEKIASKNNYSITRALALYYLGKKYQDEESLRDYIFNDNGDKLSVRNKDITKLEMAAILHTGIPAKAGWWDLLASKREKLKYIPLVLRGDFTDERDYKSSVDLESIWVCQNFATQLYMNVVGYNNENFADTEAFLNHGYVVSSLKEGYGIPLFFAEGGGHAFNAVFIGEDFEDEEQRNNINNWVLIEPQGDSLFELYGVTLTIHIQPFVLPIKVNSEPAFEIHFTAEDMEIYIENLENIGHEIKNCYWNGVINGYGYKP